MLLCSGQKGTGFHQPRSSGSTATTDGKVISMLIDFFWPHNSFGKLGFMCALIKLMDIIVIFSILCRRAMFKSIEQETQSGNWTSNQLLKDNMSWIPNIRKGLGLDYQVLIGALIAVSFQKVLKSLLFA